MEASPDDSEARSSADLVRAAKSVRERDLDNFLIEELSGSREFRRWLLARIKACFEVPSHSEFAVGKNPKRDVAVGQTDLSWAFLDASKEQVALLLIESKVADGFQFEQPERYRLEVEAARSRLGTRRAAAIVITPKNNRGVLDHPHFDATIRIEDIVEHLRARISVELARDHGAAAEELRARLEARIGLLEALAGKRPYGNWSPNPIPERVDFMEQYCRLAAKLAPGLKVTNSTGGKQATSALFTGLRTPGVKAPNIRHDFGKTQRVSIVFPNAEAAKSRLVASGLLPKGAALDVTPSGSLLVRLNCKHITPMGARFNEQRGAVEEGIQKVLQLEAWTAENATELAKLIGH